MSNEYYLGLVTDLIANLPEFQYIVENTCPTRWLDGSVCPPGDDTYNKAYMEAGFLEYLIHQE